MTDTLLERLQNAKELTALAEAAAIRNDLDAAIIKLWLRGFDTGFARSSESVVANRLAFLRDSGAL